jgi:hypothetical protein
MVPVPVATAGLQVILEAAEVRYASFVFGHDLATEQRLVDAELTESRRDRLHFQHDTSSERAPFSAHVAERHRFVG